MKARLALCGVLLAAGCGLQPEIPLPAARASSLQPVPDLAAYKLGVGDRVRIDVFGEPDLSIDSTVDPTGRLSYPLLGSVNALRKTAREIQEAVRQGLSDGFLVNPDVRVTVVQYRPFYLSGQVARPGAYAYVVGLTVEKALTLGGGMTAVASSRRIFVLHEGQNAEQRIRVGLDSLVLPGDTLLVEESLF